MAVWSVDLGNPLGLLLLPAILMPWLASPLRPRACVWNALLPGGRVSKWLTRLVPLAGSLTLGALILALAGPALPERAVERIGRGAHLVLLLDRSNSMDNTFAGRAPSGEEESKGQAAARLLSRFLAHRPHDWIGVVGFSTGALYQCPLTGRRAPNQAAVATVALPGLAYTNVAKGLALALDFFADLPLSGSRAVVLVSDGAAVIEPRIQHELRIAFKRHQVRFYWIFLRGADSPGIREKPTDPAQDNPHARPEYYLHQYFQTLGVPYQAFEADTPKMLERAIATIDRLEKRPFHYVEIRPRRELDGTLYWLAFLGVLGLLGVKMLEV
ncbi:mxaC protein [Methylomarinovum tepidoasis]|uniref:MxaC protein n=1 Tax=Methylomarinovum tepidoasis TaxID=2840183 RepID=A0AAU9CNR8_9GAMM|nr:vWA domain-containing protein [Methylomarinovum sp. IN45]BCX89257.1 mxaC protein [Methylomarinovum sp. IN45]